MARVGEVTSIPADKQIVIVGGSFRQLSAASGLAELADTVTDPQVFVFSKEFVQEAKDAAEGVLRDSPPRAKSPQGDAEAGVWVRLFAATQPPPDAIGDVSATVLSDMDHDLGDIAETTSLLAPVAPWFASAPSGEVAQEQASWVATTSLTSSQLASTAASSASPLLATLPAYVRRLRRIHLAAAAYRHTATARRRWARTAADRAVSSCQCAHAASMNLSRLGSSLQDKTAQTAAALSPRLSRWAKVAGRVPTYLQRLDRIPLVPAVAKAASAAAGRDVATLGSSVPREAVRGWAEQCGRGVEAVRAELASLRAQTSSFFSDSPLLEGAFGAGDASAASAAPSGSSAIAVAGATGQAGDTAARALLEAGSSGAAALERASRASEGEAQAVMRAAREAARRAAAALEAGAGSTGVTASGSAGGLSIMEVVSELEAAVGGALDEALPRLVRADAEMVVLQASVEASLRGAQELLGRRIGGVALKQEALVTLFARRRAVEEAGDVLAELCNELEHLRSLPKAYAAAVAEAVRRNAFTQELNARLRAVADELGRLRATEAELRDRFARRLGSHLPVGLLPGLDERPPHVQIACIPASSALPVVSADDAEAAAEAVASAGVAVALQPRAEPGSPAAASLGSASIASDAPAGGRLAGADGAEGVSGSGRDSPGLPLVPLLSAGSVAGGEDAPNDALGSAARTLQAVAAADEAMTVRVADLERENASLRAELLSLMAVVRVEGADSDNGGEDGEAGASGRRAGKLHGTAPAAGVGGFRLDRGVSGETGAGSSPQASPQTDLSSPHGSPEEAASVAPSAASAVGLSTPARHHTDTGPAPTPDSEASSVLAAALPLAELSKAAGLTMVPVAAAANTASAAEAEAGGANACGVQAGEPLTEASRVAADGLAASGAGAQAAAASPVRAALSEGGEGRAAARPRATSDAAPLAGGPPQAVGPPASPVQRPAAGGARTAPSPPPVPARSMRAASDGASPRAHRQGAASAHSSATVAREALQRIYELASFHEAEFQRHRRSIVTMLEALQGILEPKPHEIYGIEGYQQVQGAPDSLGGLGEASGTEHVGVVRRGGQPLAEQEDGFVSRAVSHSRGRDAGLRLLRDAASLHVSGARGSAYSGSAADDASLVREAGTLITAGSAFPLPPAAVLSESAPTTPRADAALLQPPKRAAQGIPQGGAARPTLPPPLRPLESIAVPRLTSAPVHGSADAQGPKRLSLTAGPVLTGLVSPEDSSGGSGPFRRSASGGGGAAAAPRRVAHSATSPAASPPTVSSADVTERVRCMAAALREASSLGQSLRNRCDALILRDRSRVSFLAFRTGDLALFTRASVAGSSAARRLFVALHHNCPRLYLDATTVEDAAKGGGEDLPDVVLVRIATIRRVEVGQVADPASVAASASRSAHVPSGLQPGEAYWEASGEAMYTMTRGVVRTSPALGPTHIPSGTREPPALDA